MCVVLICPPKQRPDLTILRACHAANPHGAGVAWRDKRRIHWRKALTPGEVNHLIQQVPGEVIIHFRWASVGGVEPLLCHPFPVTAEAALGYEGRLQVRALPQRDVGQLGERAGNHRRTRRADE